MGERERKQLVKAQGTFSETKLGYSLIECRERLKARSQEARLYLFYKIHNVSKKWS